MLLTGSLQDRIAADHPIRRIKVLADEALSRLHPTFEAMYSQSGRPSIPPERLLKAQLLMALFTVRSDRMFCEQLEYNLLFRWFLDMEMDGAAFDASQPPTMRSRAVDRQAEEAEDRQAEGVSRVSPARPAYSGRWRPLIPVDASHRFRLMPATHSG